MSDKAIMQLYSEVEYELCLVENGVDWALCSYLLFLDHLELIIQLQPSCMLHMLKLKERKYNINCT